MFNQPPMPNGSVVAPAGPAPFAPPAAGQSPQGSGVTLSTQHAPAPRPKKERSLVGTVVLLIAVIVAVVFIYLYISLLIQHNSENANIENQINAAVASAVNETTIKLEEDFAEREKIPYSDFLGPADYGSLGFKYPRTWSVYIAKDAVNGGDYEAYLNPREVEPITATSINALHVTIRNTTFDKVITQYDALVKSGNTEFTTREVGGVLANVYSGQLTNNIVGAVAILKIRDKTILIQTDAVIFLTDFYNVLDSVTLIQ